MQSLDAMWAALVKSKSSRIIGMLVSLVTFYLFIYFHFFLFLIPVPPNWVTKKIMVHVPSWVQVESFLQQQAEVR